MSSSADVGSDEEQLVIKSSKQDELNDLLGGSDDEDSKVGGNELNDLLGNSDDDSDAVDANNETDTPLPATSGGDQEGARFDELEQILGKADIKSSFKDQRAKTKSKVVLPATYKVPSDYVSAFVRTPNFIKIQTQAFDEAIHDVEAERKDFDGSTAVVRWRIKRDENGEIVLDAAGKPVKESNARMIQWSDGSMQLVVGDAVFQCKNSDVDNWYANYSLCFLPNFSSFHCCYHHDSDPFLFSISTAMYTSSRTCTCCPPPRWRWSPARPTPAWNASAVSTCAWRCSPRRWTQRVTPACR